MKNVRIVALCLIKMKNCVDLEGYEDMKVLQHSSTAKLDKILDSHN